MSLLLIALTGCSAFADLPLGQSVEAGEAEPAIAAVVGSLLSSYHYAGKPVDDAVATAWMRAYLESLDYNRMIFLDADVREFEALADTLDDDLRGARPKLQLAYAVYARYQQRVDERVAEARELLEGPIDLTDDESYHFDRREQPWPATAAEARELWRKRIEEQFILGALAERSEDDTRELLRKRYHRLLADTRSAESMDVLERYLSALTGVYDPHTVYLKPASQESFDISMQNSLEGIGATLRTVGEYTVVMDLVPGGPAEKGGVLQVNDKIIAVAQGSADPVDVIDLRIDKVVQYIRGKKGTEVRLTVIPADATDPSQTRVVTIVRDKVVLEDSKAKLEVREHAGKRIAVVDVPTFYVDPRSRQSVSGDVARMLGEMGQVDAVVVDLRQNGGGSLQEAVALTGLFIDRGPVVQIRERSGAIDTLHDRDGGTAWDGPLVVLTSPLSASASEILAGAVQDYRRGLVVGSHTTHGKGTVQTVVSVGEMMRRSAFSSAPTAGALKLTTQKFYRINGESTQVRGVNADVVVPSPLDGLELYESDLDGALPWDEVPSVAYTPLDRVDPAVLPTLRERSAKRVAIHEAFDAMREVAAEREALKKDRVVSLNLEERRKKGSADPADEDALPGGKPTEGEADAVLDEALAITVDLLGAG